MLYKVLSASRKNNSCERMFRLTIVLKILKTSIRRNILYVAIGIFLKFISCYMCDNNALELPLKSRNSILLRYIF